jgi:UDP-N-acetylglucosamine--N-acetylmuramyl-(pentapeptide) pyrophosphoryl-undecaprenol N-acetylglucosamine transferase
MTTKSIVLIMAGGTGGHVFPALAAAEHLQRQGMTVHWLGTARGIESRLVPAAGIELHCIDVTGLRGKGLKGIAQGVFNLLRSLWQSWRIVRQLQPVCVLGMGGFAAGPGGIAAWLQRKPLVIHEQNSVAGTTNRLLARFARRVLQGYPISLGGRKGQHIGNPVRSDIAALPSPADRQLGQRGQLRVLVLGGSLGAKAINELVPAACALLPEPMRPNLWHQSGNDHQASVSQDYQQRNIDAQCEAFIDDMAKAYAWADLVICRAGALTVAELTAAGVPAILIPLPHAIDDHQTENARWLADQQAGVLAPQNTLTAEDLAAQLSHWQQNPEALLIMAERARSLAKIHAAEQVATICLECADARS